MTSSGFSLGRRWPGIAGVALVAAAGCLAASPGAAEPAGVCLARAARDQVGVTVAYDPSYRSIGYPGGDVPADRGVCTDVLVRAYRRLGIDLQVLVHEDMIRDFSVYPRNWGLSRPDPNIDHRRVLNLAAFFSRHGTAFAPGNDPAAFAAGDIVVWRLASGSPHIGIVSERRSAAGTPLILHNLSRGTVEEDVLFAFAVTGHFRYLPAGLETGCDPPVSVGGE